MDYHKGLSHAKKLSTYSKYEKKILVLRSNGYTLQTIGEKLGFTEKQVHNFITRYNTKQRKLEAGIALKRNPILRHNTVNVK